MSPPEESSQGKHLSFGKILRVVQRNDMENHYGFHPLQPDSGYQIVNGLEGSAAMLPSAISSC